MHLLDTVAPGLIERMRNLSLEEQRRVARIVCQAARRFIRDIEPEIDQIAHEYIQGNELSSSQVHAVRVSAQWADERYFDLKQRGVDESVWLNWFNKARFATAVSTASRADSLKNSADALYELSILFEEASEFTTTLSKAIETVQNVA